MDFIELSLSWKMLGESISDGKIGKEIGIDSIDRSDMYGAGYFWMLMLYFL